MVSANKALLAEDGVALHAAAGEAGVDLYYEAAVAGAIPLLRPLRESLAGDQLRRVVGIVNGTTNYILSRMAETGAGFAEALAEATDARVRRGRPDRRRRRLRRRREGGDPRLAGLPHPGHRRRRVPRGHLRGVRDRRGAAPPRSAARSSCWPSASGSRGPTAPTTAVAVRVHPAMIPTTHPLAAVGGAFNAVFVEAEAAGELMFYGRGAGGEPTASAVLGDLVAVARNRLAGAAGPGTTGYAELAVRPMADTPTRYHVSLDVADKPGVLATVAQEFAAHEVSIATVRQDGHGDAATLVIVTHTRPGRRAGRHRRPALREMSAVRGVDQRPASRGAAHDRHDLRGAVSPAGPG